MKKTTVDPKVSTFIEILKSQEFQNIRICISTRRERRIRVRGGKLREDNDGSSIVYFAEAFLNGKYCCTYTTALDDAEDVAQRMKESAGIFESPAALGKSGRTSDTRKHRRCGAEQEKITEALAAAEREALSKEQIDLVEICEYRQSEESVMLIEEDGSYIADDTGECVVRVSVAAKEEGSVASAAQSVIADPYDMEELRRAACMAARRAAECAVQSLHASVAKSGVYSVVLAGKVMAELMEQYLPVFYAENIQYKKSALAGKLGTKVAAEILELAEDPFCKEATCQRLIDDEGTPVGKKYLIRDGVFAQALYNTKTALRDRTESTGNGFKPDITGDIGTMATNVILSAKGRTYSEKQLMEAAEGGIYITKLEGVFAGADTESGDFSLLATGNRIRNGAPEHALHQFTISGNICELWEDIDMIGGDTAFFKEDGACVLSPSVKVRKIAVSGV